jgi:hypothetical protein
MFWNLFHSSRETSLPLIIAVPVCKSKLPLICCRVRVVLVVRTIPSDPETSICPAGIAPGGKFVILSALGTGGPCAVDVSVSNGTTGVATGFT